MKKIVPASGIFLIAAFLLFANAPSAFAQPQKKAAGSGQGNPDPLVNAAMKNMETGVWSVNGTVTAKKPIKLHGLLAGEDFDLAMEPSIIGPSGMPRLAVGANPGFVFDHDFAHGRVCFHAQRSWAVRMSRRNWKRWARWVAPKASARNQLNSAR
jgi:hypothetical protein